MANYTASDITTDEQAALDQIKEETEAAVKYDIAAKNAKDPVTKKAMEHNKKDELEHAGLMGAVAVKENPEDKKDMMNGVKELDEIKTETAEESFIKKSISQCIKERTRQHKSSMGASFQFEKSAFSDEKRVPLKDLRRQQKVIQNTKPGEENEVLADIRTARLPGASGGLLDFVPKDESKLPWKHSKSYNPGGNVWRWGLSDLEEAMDDELKEQVKEEQHRRKLAQENKGSSDFEWDKPAATSSLQNRINELVDEFILTSPAYDVPDRSILKKVLTDGEPDDKKMDLLTPEETELVKSFFDEEGNIKTTAYENAVAEFIEQLDDIMFDEEAKSRRAANLEDDLSDIEDVDKFLRDAGEFDRVVRPRLMPTMTPEEMEAARATDEENRQALLEQGITEEELDKILERMAYDDYDPEKSRASDLNNWHIHSKDLPNIINRGNKAALRDYGYRLAKARFLSQGHDMAGEDIGRAIAEDNGGWLSKRLKATLMWDLVRKGLAFNPEDFRDILGDELTDKANTQGLTMEEIKDAIKKQVLSEFSQRNKQVNGMTPEEVAAANVEQTDLRAKYIDDAKKEAMERAEKEGKDAGLSEAEIKANVDAAIKEAEAKGSQFEIKDFAPRTLFDAGAEVNKRMKAISDRYNQMYGNNYLLRNLPEEYRNFDTGLQLHKFYAAHNKDDLNLKSSGPAVGFSDDVADRWVEAGLSADMVDDFKDILEGKLSDGEDIESEEAISDALYKLGVDAESIDMGKLGKAVFVTEPDDLGSIKGGVSAPVLMDLYNKDVVKKKTAQNASELLQYLNDENNSKSIKEVLGSIKLKDGEFEDLIKTLSDIASYSQDSAYDTNFDDSSVKSLSIYNSLLFQRLRSKMRSDQAKAGKSTAAENLQARAEAQALEDGKVFKDPNTSFDPDAAEDDLDEDDPSTNELEYLEKEGQDIEDKEADVDKKVFGLAPPEEKYATEGVADTLKDQVEKTTGNRAAARKLIPLINKLGLEAVSKEKNPMLKNAIRKVYKNFIDQINSASNDTWLANYAKILMSPKYIAALNSALGQYAPEVPQITGNKLYAPQNEEALDWLKANGYLLSPSAENGLSPGQDFNADTDFKTRLDRAISLLDGSADNGAIGLLDFLDNFPSASELKGRLIRKGLSDDEINKITGAAEVIDAYRNGEGKKAAGQIRGIESRAAALPVSLDKDGNPVLDENGNPIRAYAPRVLKVGDKKPVKTEFHGPSGADYKYVDSKGNIAPPLYKAPPEVRAIVDDYYNSLRELNDLGVKLKVTPDGEKPPEYEEAYKKHLEAKAKYDEVLKKYGQFESDSHDAAPLSLAPQSVKDEYNKIVEQVNKFIQDGGDTSSPEFKELKNKYEKFISKFSPNVSEEGADTEWETEFDPDFPKHAGYSEKDKKAIQDILSRLNTKGTHFNRKTALEEEDEYSVAEALKAIQEYADRISSPLDLEQAIEYAKDTVRGDNFDEKKNMKENVKKMGGGIRYKDSLGDFMTWASTMLKDPNGTVLGGSDTPGKGPGPKEVWPINRLAAATYVPGARERVPREDGSRSIVMKTPNSKDLADKGEKRAQIMQTLKDEFGEDTSSLEYLDRADQLFTEAFLPDFSNPEVYASHLLNMISDIYQNDVYGSSKDDIKKIEKLAKTMGPEKFIEVMEPLLYSLQDQLKKRDEDYDAFVTAVENPTPEGNALENMDKLAAANSIEAWEKQFPGLKSRYTAGLPIPATAEDKENEEAAWTKAFLSDKGRLDYHTGRPVNISKISPLTGGWDADLKDYLPLAYSDEVNDALASLEMEEAPAVEQPPESKKEEREIKPRKRWVKTGHLRGKWVDAEEADEASEEKNELPEEGEKVTKTVKKSATESKCTRVRHRSDADDLPDDTGLTMKQLREPTIRDDANGSSVKHMGDSVIKKSTSELMSERFKRDFEYIAPQTPTSSDYKGPVVTDTVTGKLTSQKSKTSDESEDGIVETTNKSISELMKERMSRRR